MPPRQAGGAGRGQQQGADDGAGPSTSSATFPEYVAFTLGQAIISEGWLPEVDVKAMVRRLAQRRDDSAYKDVLAKLQKDTHFLGLAIERIKFPWNDEWYVCVVDKEKDEAAKQMGAKYNPDEVQYFRSVVEALCEAQPQEEGGLLAAVSQIALKTLDVQRQGQQASQAAGSQAAAKARKLSQMDKEAALKAFAQDGWLHQPQQGYYTLGPRALGELKDWILSLVPAEIAEKLQTDYM
ncbi:Non-structural maintenance of chromosomes element 1 [Pleodorina starrii]|uniref:Non-structural maintenance of chromosomes element 1 homolog n=1 Tax=Pleodorina starrii TaxID=330485 RepID=A0A9W6BG25_9CHLO|nr:Non-structural maintenance of chromosomes element 1 [Pleodorina starrii]GLC51140.1 Non-structural maintenance of chromosomes element 1 [Pleodorina starrii]GLC63497.1 Non-structural maintenance of chromosomes element 1 [Pleodorina starrii]